MNKMLKLAIVEKFDTQTAFSKFIEEDESVVSRVLRGWKRLPKDKQKRWAQALGKSPRLLFNENNSQKIERA